MANDRHLLCCLMTLLKHRLHFNRIQAMRNENIRDFYSILSVREKRFWIRRNTMDFLVAPIRRTRPTTTTTEEPAAIIVEPKTAALFDENQGKKNSNIGLVLLVVLLSTLLVLIVTGFLLYKR